MADEPAIPRPVLAVAIGLAVLLAVAVAGIGGYATYTENQRQAAVEQAERERRTGPLPLAPVPAPDAGSPGCGAVLAALPEEMPVGDARVPRRELAEPAPEATAAWGDAEHDPITVRCGVGAPAELTPTSPLLSVSGVGWLEVSTGGNTSYFAVDRPVLVALTMPEGSGTAPLQELSRVVGDALPRTPVFG
ncbi:DUF3515 domain-containing protein [Saccharopolyspora sp. CA-218241]|uniref:DUF3515 domain-containing protein n=1 Tax=Saccharopolyspora sp. CA-218241 TaxID=3240027 RepID=UPI003D96ED37